MGYVTYEHHRKKVWVQEGLKGVHRDYCLCWNCKKFNPEDRDKNCQIARSLYALCVEFYITTPVWECPYFEKR